MSPEEYDDVQTAGTILIPDNTLVVSWNLSSGGVKYTCHRRGCASAVRSETSFAWGQPMLQAWEDASVLAFQHVKQHHADTDARVIILPDRATLASPEFMSMMERITKEHR